MRAHAEFHGWEFEGYIELYKESYEKENREWKTNTKSYHLECTDSKCSSWME